MACVNSKNLKIMCESILCEIRESDLDSIALHDNAEDIALEDAKYLMGTRTGKSVYEYMQDNTQAKIMNSIELHSIDKCSKLEKVCYYYISGDTYKDRDGKELKDINGYIEIGFDYDVSMRNVLIYGILSGKINPENLSELPIRKYERYKYQLDIDEMVLRGDTMNSLNTVYGEYLKFKGISSESRSKRYVSILENLNEYIDNTPEYINDYLGVFHTIGNMIMVPKEFNSPRYRKTKDYWDLTLKGIYKWFIKNDNESDEGLIEIIGATPYFPSEKDNIDSCKKWLSRYQKNNKLSWKKFIIDNSLEMYVDKEWKPIEFWEGHFQNAKRGEMNPTNEEEYKIFFTDSYKRILKRGRQIAEKLIGVR